MERWGADYGQRLRLLVAARWSTRRPGLPMPTIFTTSKMRRRFTKGNADPEDLGVRAVDDFTFEVILRSPAVHFLALQAQRLFFPVPSHAVARALEWGSVVSGAFRLKEWRPNQRVVLVRNPRYYEAEVVRLEELVFLPVRHSLLVNLYKSGDAHVTDGNFMGPPFAGALRNRTDYWTTPALDRGDYAINVRAAPSTTF